MTIFAGTSRKQVSHKDVVWPQNAYGLDGLVKWLIVFPHPEKAVEQKCAADQVKDVERADDSGVGLQEFPHEPLQSVPAYEEIGTLPEDKGILVGDFVQKHAEEGEHREGFVELHGMTWDAVAEIDAPGQRCGRAVGEIRQAREEATEAADG